MNEHVRVSMEYINMALASNYSPIFYKKKTNDRENKTVTFFAIVSYIQRLLRFIV